MNPKLLLIAIVFASCTNDRAATKSAIATQADLDSIEKPYSGPEKIMHVAPSNWTYEETVDKMDNKKNLFASCTSTNQVYFDFPYSGGSTFTLMIRNANKSNEVLLSVSKGQFSTGIDGSRGRIKFDDEKPISISYTEPEDSRSDLIFLSPERMIINKLKKAKKVMIETEFFQEGRKSAEFDVEGLTWNH